MTMVDCNGVTVQVGADVLFRERGTWIRGTVRAVEEKRYSRVRGAAGAKWLPVIVDEVESVNGNQPLPGGLLWLLRSTPTAGLAVRALES